jgi:AcrR family transcriptional regulator
MSSPSDNRGAKAQGAYHHGDLRAALLDETLRAVEEGGLDKLSLRQLAQRVGVSRGAPYHHFPNKEALVAAAVAEGFARVHRRVELAQAEATDPWNALGRMGTEYVTFALEYPQLYKMMFGTSMVDKTEHPELHEVSSGFYEHLRTTIAACVATGEARSKDVNLLSFQTWAGVHGVASLLVDGMLAGAPTGLAERPLAEVVGAVLDGMSCRADDPHRTQS